MLETKDKNGSSKILLTVVGIMFSVVVAITGLMFTFVRADVGQTEQAVKEQAIKDAETEHRVTCIEKDFEHQQYMILQIQETLKEMNPTAAQKAAAVVDSIKAIKKVLPKDTIP